MSRNRKDRLGYRNILVALDGSPSAEAAVEVAAELAERVSAVLHLAGVVRPRGASIDLGEAAPVAEPGSREFADRLHEHVQDVAGRVRAARTCPVVTTMVEPSDDPLGDSGRALRTFERRHAVDLTVLGIPLPVPGRDKPAGERRRLRADLPGAPTAPLLLVPWSDREPERRLLRPLREAGRVAAVTTGAATDPVLAHAERFAEATEAGLHVVTVDSARDESEEERLAGRLSESRVHTVALAPARRALAEYLLWNQEPAEHDDGERRPSRIDVLLCPGEIRP